MEAKTQTKVIQQLKIVRGQLEGLINMIETQQYCIPVLTQLAAADKGLKRAAALVLENHIVNCQQGPAKAKSPKELNEKLQELVIAFQKFI